MSLQNSTEIESLLELLDTHRATLHILKIERAQFSAGHVPVHLTNQINQACQEIANLKKHLRTLGHPVKDLALDFPPVTAPARNQTKRSFWAMFSRSKKEEYDQQIDHQNRQTLINTMRLRYKERLKGVSRTIPLAFAERPNAVNPLGSDQRPYDLALRQFNQTDKLLPKDSRLNDLFDQSQGLLLILGAPGAGKSFLLYELAHELVERAAADSSAPVPVIFSLASWQSDQSLQEWLITDLSQRYNTKSQNIERLFNTNSILPLLDGLDEVDTLERRKQCVAAIHTYQAEKHLAPPLVVTCREREYRDLPELHLNTALVVQPLTSTEINDYLADPEFAQLRQALAQDPSLADLARTPLFLSFMATAYRNQAPQLPNHTNSETVRQIVLSDYVSYCCGIPNNPKAFKVPVTNLRAFLTWLANGMIAHNNQQDFYIEFLQPTWLSSERWYWLWRSVTILFGVAIGILIGGVFGWIALGVMGIMFFGIIFGVVFGLGINQNKIEASEIWKWSWQSSTFNSHITTYIEFGVLKGLLCGVAGGVIGGVILYLSESIDIILAVILGLLVGLPIGVYLWLVLGLINLLQVRFVKSLLPERQSPNQAIRRSFRSIFVRTIICTAIGALAFSVINILGIGLISLIGQPPISDNTMLFGLVFGSAFGIVFGLLQFGGISIIQHYYLRLVLALSSPAPFLLVPWLEEACKRGLLMRIGGGYRFRHELLQRHFAAHQEPGFSPSSFLAETENKSQA